MADKSGPRPFYLVIPGLVDQLTVDLLLHRLAGHGDGPGGDPAAGPEGGGAGDGAAGAGGAVLVTEPAPPRPSTQKKRRKE